MPYPSLEAEGDTTWYPWIRAIDKRALRSTRCHIDSFQNAAGTLTDQQLLDEYETYAKAQTYGPTLVFGSHRLYTFTTGGNVPDYPVRMEGETAGSKNPEISARNGGATVRLNVGTGTSAWWNGNGADRHSAYFGNITFESTNGVSQFWEQSVNALYPATFHSLGFYGFQHIMGRPAAKALFTQVAFTGHWNIQGNQDVQFTIGGSDCNFWLDAFANLQTSGTVAGADRYMMVLDAMDKTNIGGGLYLTAHNNWRGIRIIGSGSTRTLNFWGCIIEGMNAGDPCAGNLMRIESHNVNLWGVRFAHAMSAPDAGENGVVQVTGGDTYAVGCMYERATGVAETVPLFYGSGGRMSVKEVKKVGSWTGLPRVQDAGADVPATDGTWTLV